jgi:hypothetical protein
MLSARQRSQGLGRRNGRESVFLGGLPRLETRGPMLGAPPKISAHPREMGLFIVWSGVVVTALVTRTRFRSRHQNWPHSTVGRPDFRILRGFTARLCQ